MDVNSIDAFSKLLIATKAQERADRQVDECCRLNGRARATYPERFSHPELLHQYTLGLILGAIDEYHRQLRANLAEAGIVISDFIENPLIQPKD